MSFIYAAFLKRDDIQKNVLTYHRHKTGLRRINNALKIIADMVKLPVPLTTYVTQHVWASIAKSKNVPINVISDALGHDSPATTQIYPASIDTSVIDHANEMIISDLWILLLR